LGIAGVIVESKLARFCGPLCILMFSTPKRKRQRHFLRQCWR